MARDDLSETERAILRRLAETDGCMPAELALDLEADLGRIYEVVADLREGGLIERAAFDTSSLAQGGRDALSAAEAVDP
ncbi:hypothetical protein [Halorhabdus salina]|uniref:hypothetical protein n=1 Tax=Halorhabdus salina TaxID=2750670 RepID=UPI0015EE8B22|nr:hypothetical protein [Halorhabdus salina]